MVISIAFSTNFLRLDRQTIMRETTPTRSVRCGVDLPLIVGGGLDAPGPLPQMNKDVYEMLSAGV